MTFRARSSWPAVAERRRAVIESRTAEGQLCTLIVERDPDSGPILSFHGAIRATAAPCPEELDELIKALQMVRAGKST